LVVLVFALIACVVQGRAAAPTLTIAEQEVIEALLSQEAAAKISKQHVIRETTSVRKLQILQMSKDYDSFAKSLREQAKPRDKGFREALEDFLKKNETAVRMVFPTNAPKGVELVSDATVKEIFSAEPNAKPNGWDLFYRRFPDSSGLITISRVGINSRGTVAIIYYGEQSHFLAGAGGIRVLKREGGKWILKRYESIGPSWVS